MGGDSEDGLEDTYERRCWALADGLCDCSLGWNMVGESTS